MKASRHISDMRLPALTGLMIVALSMLGAAPARAQLYKWVDERGVTNYSNQPPADPGSVRKLGPVGGNLSVYSPDPALTRAIEAQRRDGDRALADRVASLERQLEAERLMRQYPVAAAAAPAPCPDCYGSIASYYPSSHAVGYFPGRHRHRPLLQAQLPPGAIAGNVVGMSGYIAGQAALAAALAPPRAQRARRMLDRPQK